MSRRDGGKTMRGDMYLAWSSSEEILNRTESGGLVISLLKFALESKRVDAVLAINARDGNRCDGIPVLITDPDEVISIAEALHCVTVNIPRHIKEYLRGAFDMKLAVVSKPCDIRGIIELAKRKQIGLDNLEKKTFVEICSDKDGELFEEAIKAGYIN